MPLLNDRRPAIAFVNQIGYGSVAFSKNTKAAHTAKRVFIKSTSPYSAGVLGPCLPRLTLNSRLETSDGSPPLSVVRQHYPVCANGSTSHGALVNLSRHH